MRAACNFSCAPQERKHGTLSPRKVPEDVYHFRNICSRFRGCAGKASEGKPVACGAITCSDPSQGVQTPKIGNLGFGNKD